MREETRPVFVADDGEVFQDEKDALAHEEHLRRQKHALSKLKVWRLTHSFDATEGRGYSGTTLIVTDASSAVLLQWCLDNFGQPLSGWYGDSFYETWILYGPNDSDTVEWAIAHEGFKGPYSSMSLPWKLCVVSKQDFQWAGLPASEHPWPRKVTST